MSRLEEITVTPKGNVLEIILRIPWDRLHENRWTRYFQKQAPIDHEAIKTQVELDKLKILKTYEQTGSISQAAKENDSTYYWAATVIREASTRARREAKQKAQEQARKLIQQGSSISSVARQLGKSYETIRRWVQSQQQAEGL